MRELAVIFFCTTIIFAIGWIKYKVSSKAVIYYIEKNGYKQPNDKEIAECTQAVVKHMFKVN